MREVHKVIKFKQKAWRKPYFDMNTKISKNQKRIFRKFDNNAAIENLRKHRNIKLLTTERRRNYIVSKPNHHTKSCFTENLLVIKY